MKAPGRFARAEAQLHEVAAAATGFDNFGREDYVPGLRVLLEAFDARIDRPEAAREFCWATLVGCLTGRLYAVKGWRDHPYALRQTIERPLIITGIPRSGTTALHKLLSADPQFQGLEMWLTNTPMVRPPRAAWSDNPDYQKTVTALANLYAAVPQMRAMHQMVASEVDECLEVLKQSFISNRFGSAFDVGGYDRWWMTQSEKTAYRYYADVLRLIGTGDPTKRWLLKNPGHVWDPDALLGEFPDACIVQTHRDPAEAIPSLCSTIATARTLGEGWQTDPVALGRRELTMWSEAMQRTAKVRGRSPQNFHDVHQRDLHADPLSTVRRIYQRFGMTLDSGTEVRMKARVEADPERSHGAHAYSLEQFGLTRAAVRDSFRDYVLRFDL
jgi:hypothetical protein